ncbi:putative nucleotidyltransferase [Pedobacter cryoconitis]|uniref:Putative nucleotidyltransferase n=1 Tax=Pedobacter cryoconitis TaxID=188932 RepID=A0A7X0J545_9SPHI|nr:putative nucleotidyltransferase [Pedobacter cryoconitis]
MPLYYINRSGANHYLSITYNTLTNDLQSDEVKLKRYFYALRSLLAGLWIVEKQDLPPMEFHILLDLVTDFSVRQDINELMEIKKTADEKTRIPKRKTLNDWLAHTMENCKEKIAGLSAEKQQAEELNLIFRKYLLS